MRSPTRGTSKHFAYQFDRLLTFIWDSLMEELTLGVDVIYEWEQTYYADFKELLDLNYEFRELLRSDRR